ncbi:M15 family metallopeptidase [Cellulomonas alba]|uniref:D-alanyl-D-alanine carboxypeptidase family protein n=1 Tax=Cellulomonas alba TaxID=3053467 RepID=A0ABT7SGJ9_9CELL|nr:D-alanyl-D-alanine carboxypeptidase family protein [Cellulomonas alba]MDM7855303.1 D-alanyl-D-alanine carboxypeptidase family protein [Cellulomonas alba]
MQPPARALRRRSTGGRSRGLGAALLVVAALAASACAGPASGVPLRPTATVVADAARPKTAPPMPTAPAPRTVTPATVPAPEPRPTAAAKPRPRPTGTPATKPHHTPTPSPTTDKCETTYHGPPFFTSSPTAGGDGSNGDIPARMMTAVPWAVDSHGTGFWLLTKAERALVRLDTAFEDRFGHHLDIDLAYRDLATQKAMYQALGPSVAAKPGTSKHGTGLAIDVPEWPCEYGWGTTQRAWLVTNGPAYGWSSPWGMAKSTDAEYWHFEYVG